MAHLKICLCSKLQDKCYRQHSINLLTWYCFQGWRQASWTISGLHQPTASSNQDVLTSTTFMAKQQAFKGKPFPFLSFHTSLPPESTLLLAALLYPITYFLRFKKVGTLYHNLGWLGHWGVSCGWRDVSTPHANEGPASSALPWRMA